MASVSAFTDMMSQFLVELHKVFPQEKGIKKFMAQLELAKTANPRLVVDGFMKGITPYADKISNKDESFLLNEVGNIEFLNDLNLKDNWNDSLSSNTKGRNLAVFTNLIYVRYHDYRHSRRDTLND